VSGRHPDWPPQIIRVKNVERVISTGPCVGVFYGVANENRRDMPTVRLPSLSRCVLVDLSRVGSYKSSQNRIHSGQVEKSAATTFPVEGKQKQRTIQP